MRKTFGFRSLTIVILTIFFINMLSVQVKLNAEPMGEETLYSLNEAENPPTPELAMNGIIAVEDPFENGSWDGWYPVVEGGSVTVDENGSGIKMDKIDSLGNMDVMKRIDRISGIVSIEYYVKTDELTKWKCAPYILDSGNRDIAASVIFDNGNIKIYNGTQIETVQSFNQGQWYHIKMDIDTDSDKFDLYVDGKQLWYNVNLRNPVNHIGQLLFKIGDSNSGTLYFDNVKVYMGIRRPRAEGSKTPVDNASGLSENFENGQIGSVPDGWTVVQNNGNVSIEETPVGSGKSMKLLKTEMTNISGANVSATKNLSPALKGSISIEYKFMIDEIPSKWISMYIAENLKNAISLAVEGTSIKIIGALNKTKVIKNDIKVKQWYSIKIIADTTNDTLDLYIDGQKYLTDEPFRYTITGLNKMDFIIAKDSMGTLHVDDVNIKKMDNEEEINVPGYNPDPTVPGYSLGEYANLEPLPTGIVVEAEEMNLYNYTVENSPIAHNGKGVYVEEPGLGIASFIFNGTTGYYALNVGYYEADGKYDSIYWLKQNGTKIDYWLGQYDDDALHVRHAKDYLYVQHGDVFTIEGVYGRDPSKLDYVEFAGATSRTFERGHLIDDSYWQPVGWVPSSWTVGEEGGTASLRKLNDETPFVFDDVSNTKSVWGERQFLPQSEGTITLEYKVSFVTKNDCVSYELRSGTTPAVKLVTANGDICYENADGSYVVLMPGYTENTWYGIKVIADIDTGKASIYINGEGNKLENIDFCNPVSRLDNFYIRTPEQGTVKMAINVVELYKGYLIYDNFITTAPQNMPSGWKVKTEGGTGNIQEMKSNLYYDWNSLKIENTSVSAGVYLSRDFPGQSGQITLEYEFLLPSKVDGMSAILGNGNTPGVKIVTDNGNICYEDSSGAIIKLWENYKANLWYNIKIVADASLRTADIYVNKIKKATQVSLRNTVNILDTLEFVTSGQNIGVMWIDDIRLFKGTYASNVPEPVPASVESPYMVGIQTCDLWREGSHFGYDAIVPYDNRTPLLGYFDEGDPEVADWETKWMVEHGVELYYPAWYRPKGSLGSPIKEPRNSVKLNEGFMNSRYSDRINFAILWENGTGALDAKDFKENVVNYWIERYFKHPSYLLIDNKPVIGIWKTDDLAGQLGGDSGNAAIFEEIEAALRAEGFDGAIFLAQYNGADAAKSQVLQNRGYDYTYIYNHTSDEMVNQLDRLQKQKSTNVIPAISSISQGWGDEPWGMSERKTNIPLNEWEAGLEWLKNNFMPTNGDADASLGSRLLLLGNWNEIAEGHFLMPSNIAGFGYLDGIRQVFSTGDQFHMDVTPKDIGFGPYDMMTPKQWLTIGVTDTVPTPVESAVLLPASGNFDKNPASQADVNTTILWNDATRVIDIKKGGISVGEAVYAVNGNILTIRKEYLESQATGSLVLTVEFDKGSEAIFTIEIIDTTPTIGGDDSYAPVPTPGQKLMAEAIGGTEIIKLESILDTKNGNVTIGLDKNVLDKLIEKAETDINGKKLIRVKMPSVEKANSYTLEVPVQGIAGKVSSGRMLIETTLGTLSLPDSMLTGFKEGDERKALVTIKKGNKETLPSSIKAVLGDKPLIQLTIAVDGKQVGWINPEAPVTVSIPYSPVEGELKNPEHIFIWYIEEDGNAVTVPSGRYDAKTDTVTFTTTHFSYYAVAYVYKNFNDLDQHEWAKKSVEVLASRGIINGTSKETFSPKTNITREDYLVLLIRTLGLMAEFDNNFEDVELDTYYYEAVGIAKKLGIAVGNGENRFNPGENISRQDMMVMTARALEKLGNIEIMGESTVLDQFKDKADIANYAKESLVTLVSQGLIEGSGDVINPRENTTRAEAAVFLYRIYNKCIVR